MSRSHAIKRKQYSFQRKLKKLETLGYLMECRQVCPVCGAGHMILINAHDAMACLHCNQWLEPACSDPTCPFCADRPDNPAGVLPLLEEKAGLREQQLRKDQLRLRYQRQHDGMIRYKRRKAFLEDLKY